MKNTVFASFLSALIIAVLLIPSAHADGPVTITTDPSLNAVSLFWTTPSDIVSHELRYSTAPITSGNFSSATLVSGMPSATPNTFRTKTVTGLIQATTYYFGYQVTDSVGGTTLSTVSATTLGVDITPPAPVSGFAFVEAVNNSITLSWTASSDSDLASYDIRYSTSPIDTSNFNNATPVLNVPAAIPSATQQVAVNGLSLSTTYYFAIKSLDQIGNASTLATTRGATGISFTTDPSLNAVALFWTTPSDIVSHALRYSTAPITSGNFSSATLVSGMPSATPNTSRTKTVTNLIQATTYYFGYQFTNSVGEQPFSTVSVSTLGVDVTPPDSVSNFSVSSIGITSVTLSWTAPSASDIASYDVRYAKLAITEANFNSKTPVSNLPAAIPNASQSVTINNLQSFTDYYFGIKVLDQTGNESGIVVISGRTQDAPPPPPPPPPPPSDNNSNPTTGGTGGTPIGPYQGSVSINRGATITTSALVNLEVSIVAGTEMNISNDRNFSAENWVPFKQYVTWKLSSGDGLKTVSVIFRDANGLTSGLVQDEIELKEEKNIQQNILQEQKAQNKKDSTVKNIIVRHISNNLSFGSRNAAVAELQKRLLQEGFFSGKVTGYFGELTFAAIKKYQASNGLVPTGFVGAFTRSALNGIQPAVNASAIAKQKSNETTVVAQKKNNEAIVAEQKKNEEIVKTKQKIQSLRANLLELFQQYLTVLQTEATIR